jgi:SRSO17 transposase
MPVPLPEGNKDAEIKKKPELALSLIECRLSRGYRLGLVLIDEGYRNNTAFVLEREKRQSCNQCRFEAYSVL